MRPQCDEALHAHLYYLVSQPYPSSESIYLDSPPSKFQSADLDLTAQLCDITGRHPITSQGSVPCLRGFPLNLRNAAELANLSPESVS